MPRFDGTGPMGQGPMTGRGMGFCALAGPAGNAPALAPGPMTGRAAGYWTGYPAPGYMDPTLGRGPWNWSAGPVYGPPLLAAYGRGAGYPAVWGRPARRFGWGFGRGFGRGRRWFGR